MMATQSKFEPSILKIRLGNLQPLETVKIEFEMIGKLNCEQQNSWNLSIPSHIAPRYQTQIDSINSLFKKLLLTNPDLL